MSRCADIRGDDGLVFAGRAFQRDIPLQGVGVA
jgi:hypothetical protein